VRLYTSAWSAMTCRLPLERNQRASVVGVVPAIAAAVCSSSYSASRRRMLTCRESGRRGRHQLDLCEPLAVGRPQTPVGVERNHDLLPAAWMDVPQGRHTAARLRDRPLSVPALLVRHEAMALRAVRNVTGGIEGVGEQRLQWVHLGSSRRKNRF
jgi:hypothetical protein